MGKIKKILFILLVMLLIVACAAYIDYYVVKTRNTTPKIAIKEEVDENLTVYNAIMYRVWYCKVNQKYTIGDYKGSQAVCLPRDSYDDNGNYTNKENVLILKYDLDLISKYFTIEEIGVMKQEDVDKAKLFASEYGKIQYKKLENEETEEIKSEIEYDIVVFPEYVLNNNEYQLKYNEEKMYCMNKKEEIALYEDETCEDFEKISVSNEVCNLYKNTSLKNDELLMKLCEE